MSFSIAITEEAPLKVQVTYADASKERKVLSKLIESGTITATRSGDGKIVSSFENLLLSMSSEECSPQSGTMTSKIYVEGASEPSKIYKLSASEGDYKLEDITDAEKPVEVEDVDFEVCDIADHKD